MKTNRSFKNAKGKRDGGAFVALPMSVLNSRAYLSASPYARMLLLDLSAQLRGNNNGDLAAPWKWMKPRGWRSEATLQKAKKELIHLGLIAETRKGARPNKATLYAVTWHDLGDCGGKLDIMPSAFPRGAYRLLDAVPAIASRVASVNTRDAVGQPP